MKKEKEKTETVGAASLRMQEKGQQLIVPKELQEEIHQGKTSDDSFESQIYQCIERGRKTITGPFYVVVLFKKERHLYNTIRQYFFPRKSCPTPEYDQVVYSFNPSTEELKFLWVIPDKEACGQLPLVAQNMSSEDREIVKYVTAFRSGELDKLCQRLNGELVD